MPRRKRVVNVETPVGDKSCKTVICPVLAVGNREEAGTSLEYVDQAGVIMAEFRQHQILKLFVRVGQPCVFVQRFRQDSLTMWVRNNTIMNSNKDLDRFSVQSVRILRSR
jgi:hypothetical protein